MRRLFELLKSFIVAAFATTVWLVITVAVALPGKWTAMDLDFLSTSFINDNHFLYFFMLILTDLFISIAILNDIHLKRRISHRNCVGIIFFCAFCTTAVSSVNNGGPDNTLLKNYQTEIFVLLMCLYGAIRFIMYWSGESIINPVVRGTVRRSDSAASVNVQPKFTAIPVGSIKPSGMEE